MSAWGSSGPHWRRLFALAACVLCFLPVTVFAEQSQSDDAFERLRQDLQNELDARHKTAQLTDEIFPGATAALIWSDGRVVG